MPQPSRTSRVGAAAKAGGRKVLGPKAIGRLEKSLDAADLAMKDLRKEVGRGGRDVVKDFEQALKGTRQNLRSLSRTLARDLEKMQKAATSGSAPRGTRRATAGTTRRTTAKRSGTSRSTRSGASRTRATGRRSTAAKRGGSSGRSTTKK